MTNSTTYQCPRNFETCGEYVTVDFGDFDSTTVRVQACDQQVAWGASRFYTVKKSEALAFTAKDGRWAATHQDGLVTMEGSV